jgi:phage tail sheath protein FI
MPEYLHPGVYIQETSYRGKALEGVSTSTAGLVGSASRGPVGTPTLVTSFAEFTRQFGQPVPIANGVIPGLGDYLGYAVRAFFDNGGLRAYIVRVLAGNAVQAHTTTVEGAVVTLTANQVLRAGTQLLRVTSLRDVQPTSSLRMFVRTDPGSAWLAPVTLALDATTPLDPLRNTIKLANPLTGVNLAMLTSVPAQNVYFDLGAAITTAGPTFTAAYPGEDGNQLAVQIRPSDRPMVAVNGAAAADTLQVASTAGFYTGAVVEYASASGAARVYQTVIKVDTPNLRVQLDAPVTAPTTGAFLRVLEIDVLVYDGTALAETFAGLTWNKDTTTDASARYYVDRVNDPALGSRLVTVTAPAVAPSLDPDGQPMTADGQPQLLTLGNNGSALGTQDLIGNDGGPGHRTGIEALRERDDIALVAVPGVTDPSVQGALITHCELLKYRFAVLDGEKSVFDIGQIEAHRNHYDTKYAGYYTPWLDTEDLATGRNIVVPPSGHVLGICARVDNDRGVWKAPANEVVRGITDVDLRFGDGEQDVLNPEGINLIREFDGRGIRVWGARTLSSDTEWKYVPVRRLFIFLEHSIDRGTQWVVFEPNNEALWQRVVASISSFLFGVWKQGALMGTKPEEAYFVRCDRTTMTQDDIDNGRLVCQIGVAPAYPAEFVIFQIGQFTASTNQA